MRTPDQNPNSIPESSGNQPSQPQILEDPSSPSRKDTCNIDFGDGFLTEENKYGWGVFNLPAITGIIFILLMPFAMLAIGSHRIPVRLLAFIMFCLGFFVGNMIKSMIMGRTKSILHRLLFMGQIGCVIFLVWRLSAYAVA